MKADREAMAAALGYAHARTLATGEVAGVMRMLFTFGLFVGLDDFGYARRYCYERRQDAIDALMTWNGAGDPPGPWIKVYPGERLGPGATA